MEESNKYQIWVDKYRPKFFKDIIGQEGFIERIKYFVETNSLPHLLFAGTPGTGKTTTALVIARELYGENNLEGNVLELNASDDRGIDVIRNQIKEFAKLKSLVKIPFKIIILDEADSLTRDAQQALRRTMEKYSATCRFILACNEISKIIDPIQSRCVIFKFKPLNENDLKKLIEKISKNENFEIDKEAEEILINYSKGDLRKLENTLQAAAAIDKKITKDVLEKIIDFIEPKDFKELIENAFKGDFYKYRDLLIKLKSYRGLSSLEILKGIYKEIIDMEGLDPKKKIKIIDKIATIEFRIIEGSDDDLQLEALLAFFSII
jgi:replication factor C small subunit